MRALPDRTADALSPGDTVLVVAPPFAQNGTAACTDLLSVDPAAHSNILSVIYTESPADRQALCEDHLDGQPANTAIVSVNAMTRSAPCQSDTAAGPTVKTVSSPSDLTGLGIQVTNQLTAWTDDAEPHQILACFHSITSLLQYVDVKRAYRFLDELMNKLRAAGAITHFHIDPGAHDDQTVNTLTGLFDAVCRYDDGEWTLQTR